MIPRFIGNLNWAPQQHDTPDLWRLEEPYAQVTSDGYLIMCPLWHGINGASIPRILWPIPFIGHPFEGNNKFWSPTHDMGYDGSAIVIDLKTPQAQVATQETWAKLWARIPDNMRIAPRSLGRPWWDRAMLEGMQICGESKAKQFVVYRGVRIGAGPAWRRCGRELRNNAMAEAYDKQADELNAELRERVVGKAGLIIDGGSKPQATWSIFGHPWNEYLAAYTIHDAECATVERLFAEGALPLDELRRIRRQADRHFRESMAWIQCEILTKSDSRWESLKNRWKFKAVRLHAWWTLRRKRKRDEVK